MEKKLLLRKLDLKIEAISKLQDKAVGNEEFKIWHHETETLLITAFGEATRNVLEFRRMPYSPRRPVYDSRGRGPDYQRYYRCGLSNARALLTAIRNEVKESIDDLVEDGSADEACMHPAVELVSKKAMQSGLYADAVERAFKEINSCVKKLVKGEVPTKLDGVQLMQKVFSPEAPMIRLADSADPSEQDIQRGYMYMFAGGMSAIRNPKAHDNIEIDKNDATRKLYFASMLMYKLDEAERKGWIVA